MENYDGNRAHGYQLQDNPGEISFIDREIFQEGSVSLRFQDFTRHPAGNARLMQEIAVIPYRQYRVVFWARTEDMPENGMRFQVLNLLGSNLAPWNMKIPGTAAWRQIVAGFNSGANSRVRVYIGVWGGRSGRFWIDDLRVEEAGLLNLLRRDGAPLVVRSDESEAVYEEGKDFQFVRDPQLNFRWDHDGPPLRLLPDSRIQDGERLRVSYYHGMFVMDDQVSVCMSEPRVYDYWRAQAQLVHELLGPARYLLAMDEIRLGGSCEACKRRQLSMAQILAECFTRQFDAIRANNPEAEVWTWSDMLDPNHNAVANYYLVDGDYGGVWDLIPPEMKIMCWYFGKRSQSLAHFAGLGRKTMAGAYYDADTLDNSRGWLEALDATEGAEGIMYTTWEDKYGLMPDFGDLVSQPRP
jgi:hypothetical protein